MSFTPIYMFHNLLFSLGFSKLLEVKQPFTGLNDQKDNPSNKPQIKIKLNVSHLNKEIE